MGRLPGGRLRSLAAVALVAGAGLAGGAVIPASSEPPKPILGTSGADVLSGTRRADRIDGRPGADRISGRGGADVLIGGPGYDRIAGGRGRDVIRARDRHLDVIDCGPGRDTAYVDRVEDGVYDCERLVPPGSARRKALPR
jgi:Ca2+-binding RTX toxin-like protein